MAGSKSPTWQEAYDHWLAAQDLPTRNRINLPNGPGEAIYFLHRIAEDKPAWWLKLEGIASIPRDELLHHLGDSQEALRFLADMFRFHKVETPNDWHLVETEP